MKKAIRELKNRDKMKASYSWAWINAGEPYSNSTLAIIHR